MSIISKELQPSKENLLNTLKSNAINRNSLLEMFINLLNCLEDGCSVAIDGKWGDGKTFFVKQAKLILDFCNPSVQSELTEDEKRMVRSCFKDNAFSECNENPQVTVYYDAWLNDNDEDPLLSLVSEISKNAIVGFPNINSAGLFDNVTSIAEALSGKGVKKVFDILKGENVLQELKKQKTIEEMVSSYLNALLPERGNRLIIFIDELDRCRPSFAVKMLERIKHYFSNDKITFVFSINTNQLQHSLRRFYGDKFDANKYLDRFFDFRIALPETDIDKYLSYLEIPDESFTFDQVCRMVAKHFGFAMRETEKYFRTAYTAAYSITHHDNSFGFEDDNGKNYGFMVIVPIIIGLRMVDINCYYDFINGNNSQPLLDIVTSSDLSHIICRNLLSSSETFASETQSDKTIVALKEKLSAAYDAIFNNDSKYLEKKVGMCTFKPDLKSRIIEISSMISPVATY